MTIVCVRPLRMPPAIASRLWPARQRPHEHAQPCAHSRAPRAAGEHEGSRGLGDAGSRSDVGKGRHRPSPLPDETGPGAGHENHDLQPLTSTVNRIESEAINRLMLRDVRRTGTRLCTRW